MEEKFESNILKNQLFNKKDSLLLAISGGVDSVVLAHLLKHFGYDFSLAHCNFKLRADESEADETFCKNLAKQLNVNIFVTQFDVKSYCKKNKVSTQMAARELRYNWFKQLMQQHRFDHLLTAHHANDVVETVFINLLRGTGINGIKGISEKKENRVRPLLSFTKDEIERYAKKNDIHFRLDKSNLETKYERNFLRLEVIPKLKSINQNLEETFYKNSQRFSQEAGIVNDFLESKTKEITRTDSNYIKIDKRKLQSEKFKDSIINFILKPYHFNETQQKDVLTNISANAQIGKKFHSTTHRLTIDRNDIVVEPLEENKTEEISINSLAELKENKLLRFSNVKVFKTPLKTEIYIEKNKLIFPISIRPKKTGDKFKPFGMKGFKLLSDFLKDEKLNNFEKERCKLLVNGNGEIIWVMGKRSDERYRVNETENNLIKLTLIGE